MCTKAYLYQARSQSINSLLPQTQEQEIFGVIEPTWRIIAGKNHELFKKRELFLAKTKPGEEEVVECPCGVKTMEGTMVSCYTLHIRFEAGTI